SRRKYHCGLNWWPFTRSETKSRYFGLNIGTHTASSTSWWSACVQILFAAAWSVMPVFNACWILGSTVVFPQYSAMFGLELEFGWNELHPRRMLMKSDAAG